jgi:hypothetical protein
MRQSVFQHRLRSPTGRGRESPPINNPPGFAVYFPMFKHRVDATRECDSLGKITN